MCYIILQIIIRYRACRGVVKRFARLQVEFNIRILSERLYFKASDPKDIYIKMFVTMCISHKLDASYTE